ncbi:lachesin [Cephus cinctus]|uniref:Lachesin n=1 Tax=Cephus cinctus TaxID=211228 RepID=A0AAJ7RQQ5_CEPCN|nr:lachesin [Cephus cinctus]XP_024944969.1 lachesin [Cephus cinctus]XP_024944970.1 lachesin [Cephus cinctus]
MKPGSLAITVIALLEIGIRVRAALYQEATPTVGGPVFEAPIGNQTAPIGREVVFSCSVRNVGKYKIGWLRASDNTIISVNARTVTQNFRITVSYEIGRSAGTSSGTRMNGTNQSPEGMVETWKLHIKKLEDSDGGCYMCQINTSPMISQLGCVEILVPPDIVEGSDTSADLAVSEGGNATLSCKVTGRPIPRVSWKREDGEPISIRQTSPSPLGGNGFVKYDMYNGSVLQFYRVERKQMGTYLCIANNDVPPAISKRVTLTVEFAPVVKAPNQLLGAPLGTDVQLECYVEAYPKTINYWLKNRDEMLLDGAKYSIREERSGYTVLMWLLIKGFTRDDVGSYNCVSTNSLGRAEGTLRLYEIRVYSENRGSHGKDHISIIGGLAEAARGSGASRGNDNSGNNFSYSISLILLLLPALWPR